MAVAYLEPAHLFRLDSGDATLAFGILDNTDIPSIGGAVQLRRRRGEFSTPAMRDEYPGFCAALRRKRAGTESHICGRQARFGFAVYRTLR